MEPTILLTITCIDKPGLIAKITSHLFDFNINLADTHFIILNDNAEFSAVCEIPSTLSADELIKQLHAIDVLQNATIQATPFQHQAKTTEQPSHHITLQGNDQPGLVTRITEVFLEYSANIMRMETKKLSSTEGTQYIIQLWVLIPEARSAACLATITNTASWLKMQCDYEAI